MSKAGGPNKGAVPLHKAMAVGEKYEEAAAQTKVPAPPPGKDTR